ncbi:MAG: c-type cytochrome [Solirubrobacteraceae bacterium]
MILVILFLAFWVLLALGLFFIAMRGGLSGARRTFQTQSRAGRRGVGTTFAIVYVGLGIALPVALLDGNHANASSQIGGIKLTAAEKRGRELFGVYCTVCHTLAAASASGKVGPNLDTLAPPLSLVAHTLEYGCLPNPPANDPQTCLGQGIMPPAIVQGKDANDVAQFVAKVAGKE